MVQILVTALPGFAAIIALIFTWLSINATTKATNNQLHATNKQLQITEQGQITDRYNAAVANLGSASVDVRLGGIYALQRIMQDSPRDQPTVVAVLCAFVRNNAHTANTKPSTTPGTPRTSATPNRPPTDIQAVLTVVGRRNRAHDGGGGRGTFLDLNHTQLVGAYLEDADLFDANLTGANLTGAFLWHADLGYANLAGANLTGANLEIANLSYANLYGANLTGEDLTSTNLDEADLTHANVTGAKGLPA